MQILKTKSMKRYLRRGLKLAKTKTKPSNGSFFNLIYETLKNGWHYQIEYVYDTRCNDKPYIAVYAFKPPERFHARLADYVLTEEVRTS